MLLKKSTTKKSLFGLKWDGQLKAYFSHCFIMSSLSLSLSSRLLSKPSMWNAILSPLLEFKNHLGVLLFLSFSSSFLIIFFDHFTVNFRLLFLHLPLSPQSGFSHPHLGLDLGTFLLAWRSLPWTGLYCGLLEGPLGLSTLHAFPSR